jgi:IstB-like ATP binding protein
MGPLPHRGHRGPRYRAAGAEAARQRRGHAGGRDSLRDAEGGADGVDGLAGQVEETGGDNAEKDAAGERRPIIITSNKSLTEWSSITQDVSLAAAIADRLLHHGEVFYLKGPSWRLKGRDPDHNLHSEAPS